MSDHNYLNTKRNNLDVTKSLELETVPSFHLNTEINDNVVVFPTERDSQQPPPPQLSSQDNHLCHFANCGKTFNKVCNLVAHLSNHISNGAGSYQCPEPGCGSKFVRPDELKRHSWAHNTTSRFACQVCGRRYNRADHFKVHIAKCSQTNAVSPEECIGGMDTEELEGKRVAGNYID